MKYRVRVALSLAAASLLLGSMVHADEAGPAKTEAALADAGKVNRELAREANELAAEKAVKSVLENNKLDLDIRLIGPTSVKIAADR